MACSVTETAKSGKYQIETQYVTDPSRNTVLMRVKLKPSDARLRLYARFDATVNGNGGGGAGNGGARSATADGPPGPPGPGSPGGGAGANPPQPDYPQPGDPPP